MLGRDIAEMHANFHHSSSSHSGDMVGAHQNLNVSYDLTTPLRGWFITRGLLLATINLCTKFEISISTHSKDIKSDTKYRKWGDLG